MGFDEGLGRAEDLRERVVTAVEAGTPPAEIVRVLRVSLATIGGDVRLHREGRALAGKRHPGMRPHLGEPERAALAAQLVAVGTDANKEVFLTYLDHGLCPAWRAAQTVVMDHLSGHQNEAVRERTEAARCRWVFLPAYSPGFSPIENAFAKLKGLLRQAKARTQEALPAAITAGLATMTAENARAWFDHCGFPITQSI